MTAPEFTDDELWPIMWALLERYAQQAAHRDACLRYAAEGLTPTIPGTYADHADSAARRLAEIDGIIAKLPDHMRRVWAEQRTRSGTVTVDTVPATAPQPLR